MIYLYDLDETEKYFNIRDSEGHLLLKISAPTKDGNCAHRITNCLQDAYATGRHEATDTIRGLIHRELAAVLELPKSERLSIICTLKDIKKLLEEMPKKVCSQCGSRNVIIDKYGWRACYDCSASAKITHNMGR
jgi:hypothetical protein